jgi:hypothetical protein
MRGPLREVQVKQRLIKEETVDGDRMEVKNKKDIPLDLHNP